MMKNTKSFYLFSILTILITTGCHLDGQSKNQKTIEVKTQQNVQGHTTSQDKFEYSNLLNIHYSKKFPNSTKYFKFYKFKNEYLFELKDKSLFFMGRDLFTCIDRIQVNNKVLCQLKGDSFELKPGIDRYNLKIGIVFLNLHNVRKNDSVPIEVAFNLNLELIDLFATNPENEMNKSMKADSKSAIVRIDGNNYPLPEEDGLEIFPEKISVDVLQKRGKRFLSENPKLKEYAKDLHPCLVKHNGFCELLVDEKYPPNKDLGFREYKFAMDAINNLEKYITYNYNRTPCVFDEKSTEMIGHTYCFYRSKNKYGWVLHVERGASYQDHELFNPYEMQYPEDK